MTTGFRRESRNTKHQIAMTKSHTRNAENGATSREHGTKHQIANTKRSMRNNKSETRNTKPEAEVRKVRFQTCNRGAKGSFSNLKPKSERFVFKSEKEERQQVWDQLSKLARLQVPTPLPPSSNRTEFARLSEFVSLNSRFESNKS